MIVHKLHSFLLHSSSLIFLSPNLHALFVPWKKRPEVTAPPPTSDFIVELIRVVRNAKRCEKTPKHVALTHRGGSLSSHQVS